MNPDRARIGTEAFVAGDAVYTRDYRDMKNLFTLVEKLVAALYECDAVGLKLIKRQSHQLLTYLYSIKISKTNNRAAPNDNANKSRRHSLRCFHGFSL